MVHRAIGFEFNQISYFEQPEASNYFLMYIFNP